MSKVISELLWFMITSLSDWFRDLAPLFQPIRRETKTNRGSRVHIFPRFVLATCNLRPFRLAKVITLVLVLRHSIETCYKMHRLNWYPSQTRGRGSKILFALLTSFMLFCLLDTLHLSCATSRYIFNQESFGCKL